MNAVIRKREVETLGATTRTWEYGPSDGAPLVLVHGFRGDHHGLEGLALEIARLAPEIRVIVPDLPGFGETSAIPERKHDLELFGEWLSVFCEESVGDQGFAILGHSFGSLVVANALSQGLVPSRTILINPIAAPALEGTQAVMTRLAVAYYKAADLLPESSARRLLGNPLIVRVMSEVMAKTGDRELRSWIHEQHHRFFSCFADSRSLLEAFRASVEHTVTDYADSFATRTLLLAGDRDDITPLAKQLALARRIADATLRIVPGVGHLIHYEAVDYAVSEILEFLRSDTSQ